MYRFSDWMTSLRPDFWKVYYAHPELLSLFAHENSVLAAQNGGFDLLAAYDICEIGEHNPGHTVSWVPIALDRCTYVIGSDYPYQFDVDAEWLYIDCLYDKLADPTIDLQNVVDFILKNSKLCFVKQPAKLSMYVSKGLYAGTRLADDFGTAFGYVRKDSYHYRDTMLPLMSLFYKGPTIHNIVAAANVMISNPVAKYGSEKIVNTTDGDVITDKYRYDLGGSTLAYHVGQIIDQHAPFSDAIEFYTDKTSPGWWADRIARMFQKYKIDGTITPEQRDQLMDVFLKYFVAHIRINLNKIDWHRYQFLQDVWELLLDGSPVRTDYILSMYYHAYDLDMPIPNFDVEKVKLHTLSIWSGVDKGAGLEQWIYAPRIVKPLVASDGATDCDWCVDSLRYHILDADKKFQEFWSTEPMVLSYVEPHIDHWYCRNTMNPQIPLVSTRVLDSSIPLVQELATRVVTSYPDSTTTKSIINDMATVSDVNVLEIYGDQNLDHEELDEWTCNGTVHLGIEGLVVGLGMTDYALSPGIQIGGIPKNVRVRMIKALAKNTSLVLEYSLNASTWLPIPSDSILRSIKGLLYFKITIQASDVSSPVLKGLDLTIRI